MARKPINKAIGATRGYRNCNPGNIRLTFDKDGKKVYWNGEIDGADKSFKTFKNMYYGYRAIFVTLASYFKKGFNTIEKIVNRYAPSSDNNDTNAYMKTLEKYTNKTRDEELDFNDTPIILLLVAGISKQENGTEADGDSILQGHQLFMRG